MKPRFVVGLLVGLFALVVTACVSRAIGFCGPVVSLFAGAVAAFIAVGRERPATKADGARVGATAAAVAAALALVGQIIGGLLANNALHRAQVELPIGNVPTPDATMVELIVFYSAGATVSFCLGLVGVALAGGVGYLVGQLATRPAAPPPPTMPPY